MPTVSTETSQVAYNGAGTTGPFTVPFYFLEASHLQVIREVVATGVQTVLTLTTHYSVTGAGEQAGGTVTLITVLAVGERLIILRDVPITQAAAYPRNDPFPAATHEQAVNKLTMIAQQIKALILRALIAPAGEAPAALPAAADRAGLFLAFDADGDPVPASGTGGDSGLRVDLASTGASPGSTLIGAKQSATGSVARSQHDRNGDFYHARDFGIVADGTDQTTKMIAALASGENIVFQRGIIGLDGDAALTIAYARMGTKLIGAGTTDVANAPTRGTVFKRLAGTGPMLTIATYTEGIEIAGICFDQNSLGGNAIKTGMHDGHIHDIIVHNQGGTSYGVLCTAMNVSLLERIRFTGTCYGGVLCDDTAGAGYGALYSRFNNIKMKLATGALSEYGFDAIHSSDCTLEDFYVQGGKGIRLQDNCESTTFINPAGEMDGADAFITARVSTTVGLNIVGGRVTQVGTSAGATPFFDLKNIQGFSLEGFRINDEISAASRPYFLLEGIINASFKTITCRNGSGNSHYCFLSTTTRSDFVKIENVYAQSGTIVNSVRLGSSSVDGSNMNLSFNAASQLMEVRRVTGTVDSANCANGLIYVGGPNLTDTGKLATSIGYRGVTGYVQTVDADAMVANEISLIDGVGRNGNNFRITGTKNITSIDASSTIAGRRVELTFAGILTFTDGNNLKLAGNFVTAANSSITLNCSDGTNWVELARSAN